MERLADRVDKYCIFGKYVWLMFIYFFLKCLSSFIFWSLLRLRTSRMWLAYHYWYAYHSLRNHGEYDLQLSL